MPVKPMQLPQTTTDKQTSKWEILQINASMTKRRGRHVQGSCTYFST